jgi:toxin-antitoxin system PIN domain toxin
VTCYLLDVSVLIPLIDPAHVRHRLANAWFDTTGSESWATCPITENAVLRIVGNSRYPNSPGPPAAVAGLISELRRLPGHQFWGDDVSLFDSAQIDCSRLMVSGQITDTYLLALVQAHGGQLATLDSRIVTDAVIQTHPLIHLLGSHNRLQ